jgi:eukaryotic-like serine/threonine-protein kinase
MDIAREQRVMRLFEEALDWPVAAREARLQDLLGKEPDFLAAVLAMLRADAKAAMLPTEPPEPASLDEEVSMPERIGNYRIIEEIGRGGMGLVYRAARDDGLFDQQVAIKVIRRNVFSATTQEQFANERRILARLHHPHIAQLLDGGVSEDDASYIIMELINGTPITDYADANALGLDARLSLFGEACDALEFAHRELVVHADVKPSNVVVADGFGVKLLDFGIARLVGEDGGRASSAHTPGYSSPARLSGARSTPTDDVFALGVLMQALIDGVAGADDDLRAVAAKAASEDASVRYGAVSELADDIARWQRHEAVTARVPDRKRSVFLLWRRNRLMMVAGAALTITAIGMTFLYLRADAARESAERRFGEVRNMANYMLFDLDPQMARLTGSLPARRSAAQKSSQFLASLGVDAQNDPDLSLEIVRSHLRLAGIYGYDPVGGLNDFPRAKDHLAQADKLLRLLQRQRPGSLQLDLAQGEYYLASAADKIIEESSDALPKADAFLKKASDQFEKTLQADPKNTDAEYGRWRTIIYRMRLLIYDGKSKESVTLALSERNRNHLAPKTAGQQIEFDFLNTLTMMGLAQAQYEIDQYDESLKSYQEALKALQKIISTGRGGFETDSFVTVALSGIGDCKAKLGESDEAIRYFKLSLAGLIDLRSAGPNDALDDDIAVTQQNLAIRFAKMHRAAEAEFYINAAISDRKNKAQAAPGTASLQRHLAVLMQSRARIFLLLNDSAAACTASRAAFDQWKVAAKRGSVTAMDRQDSDGLPSLEAMLKKCGISADTGSL